MFDELRLNRLINAYFDQCLVPDEKRELEIALLSSARARQYFLDFADWHSLNRECVMREQGDLLMGDSSSAHIIPLRRKICLAAGIAACALMAWIFLFQNTEKADPVISSSVPDRPQNGVALLAQVSDAEWESSSLDVGSAVPESVIQIRKGTIRLDFYSGARVTLEGPATFSLISPDLARLHHGKLTAYVPPSAEGFVILNDQLRVVDRGTEFGMIARGEDDCEVHVFKGEVELHGKVPENTTRALFGGEAVAIRSGKSRFFSADRSDFISSEKIKEASARQQANQLQEWRTKSEAIRQVPGLLAYYDFEKIETGSTQVKNRAPEADESSKASVVGCESLSGRWPENTALGFAKASDRVRFRLSGQTNSLTMMAWVRVDSLPQNHNSLFSMTPDEVGEIHWKIDESGRLLLGLRAETAPEFTSWERLVSPCIISTKDFGCWIHLATVIDGEKHVMRHFLNGREVAAAPITRQVSIRLGRANLGNYDADMSKKIHPGMLRGFNGRIDEFALFRRALDAAEIGALK